MSNIEGGTGGEIQSEIIAIQSNVERTIQALKAVGERAYSDKISFSNHRFPSGDSAVINYGSPKPGRVEMMVALATNIHDPEDQTAKWLGLKCLDYRIRIYRASDDEGQLQRMSDERGSVFGTFFMDKFGKMAKIIQIPAGELRKTDLIVDYVLGNKVEVMDAEAMDGENLPGVLETIGVSVNLIERELPNVIPYTSHRFTAQNFNLVSEDCCCFKI